MPLRHIKWITPGTHCTPEQLGLLFHTPNGYQGSVNDMCLQDMNQLCWSPTGTGFRQPISFVGKPQLFLQVFSNPLSQLCGQPAQSRVSRPVYLSTSTCSLPTYSRCCPEASSCWLLISTRASTLPSLPSSTVLFLRSSPRTTSPRQ